MISIDAYHGCLRCSRCRRGRCRVLVVDRVWGALCRRRKRVVAVRMRP